ncbi:response regulator [Methylobacterium symbioticum]|uniref:response regulator n=1 Tax=Methylobacterium symbioticum TaxID=2584084 RepID=UPI00115C0BD1|nr:response regulator [Methylobacterium symbioticum]
MTADRRQIAILIAETDVLIRMVTADMLADVGFQTIEVRTAAEAVKVLEGSALVRMLIIGRNVVGDGIALAHFVDHRWPTVGIIVTSGGQVDPERELPSRARLLRKPYDFADLIREVEAGLEPVSDESSAAPVLPSGAPPHTGVDLSNGVGAVAAATTQPDKT